MVGDEGHDDVVVTSVQDMGVVGSKEVRASVEDDEVILVVLGSPLVSMVVGDSSEACVLFPNTTPSYSQDFGRISLNAGMCSH